MPSGKHPTSDRKPEKLSLTLPPIGRPCNQRKSTCEIDRPGLHRDEPLSAQSRSNRTDSTTLTPSSRSMSESGYSTVQGEANVKAFGVQTTNSRQSSSTDASYKWDQIGEFRPLAQVARPTTSTLRWQDQIDFASFYLKTDLISPIRNEQAPIQSHNTFMPDQKANASKSTLRPQVSADRRTYQQSSHDRGLQSMNTANSRMMFTKPDSTQLSTQQHDFVRSFQRLNINSDYEQRSNDPTAHPLRQGYYSQQAMSLGQSAILTSNDPVQKGSDTFHGHVTNTLNSDIHSGYAHPLNGGYYDELHVRGAGSNTQNRSRRFFYGAQDDAMYLAQRVHNYYPPGPRLHDNFGSINAGMNSTTALPYEPSEQNSGNTLESTHIVRSQMLEDFRMNHKTRKFEFREIRGYIVEFSGDQLGSRFIQHKLETANSDEKDQVFAEIAHDARQLMTDVFGNYVIQKLFEHGSQSQKKVLANQMRGHILALSTQTYGCRVVQKAFEHILTDQQASLVRELDGHILKVVENQNGNHVVQKAIECIPGEYVDFIVQAHRGHVHYLSKHSYGCRVIQRMLEYCQPPAKRLILDELHHDISDLIQDPFGNYVVQHVIVNGEPCDRKPVIDKVQVKLLDNAMHKFASNVVEKAMDYADEEQRNVMLRTLTGRDEDGQSLPTKLLNHQFGNYVIQKAAAYLRGPLLYDVVEEMERYLIQLRRVSTGKQVAALEETIRVAKSRLDPPRQYSSTLGVPTQPSRFNIGRR